MTRPAAAASGTGEPLTELPTSTTQAPAEGEELARLKRERDEFYDLLLRKSADFENYRKRIGRERHEESGRAAAALLVQLLPIVDDLERAIQAGGVAAPGEAFHQGLEIIHRQLLELLRRQGVKPIETTGALFDPHLHEAINHEPSPDRREGEVITEIRKGYTLGDRLLRPALVTVAKA